MYVSPRRAGPRFVEICPVITPVAAAVSSAWTRQALLLVLGLVAVAGVLMMQAGHADGRIDRAGWVALALVVGWSEPSGIVNGGEEEYDVTIGRSPAPPPAVKSTS